MLFTFINGRESAKARKFWAAVVLLLFPALFPLALVVGVAAGIIGGFVANVRDAFEAVTYDGPEIVRDLFATVRTGEYL